MFPDWHDDIHIPTIGDDIIVVANHIITLEPNREHPQSFRMAIQPHTGAGVISDQGRAIGVLLNRTHSDAALFLDRYVQSSMGVTEIEILRVNLKNLLENYRSALEYTAHYVAGICVPKPPENKVQFPVAELNDTATTFALKLDQWFPGLITSAPKVRDYLITIQDFSGVLWLRQLADLTNFNKHRTLSAQEPGDFHSVVVKFGDVGVRLGELGFRSLSIEAGGALRFANSAGQQVNLLGPVMLNAETKSLPGADSRIEVICQKRRLYRIHGYSESIAHILWTIDKNVFRAVDQICALLP